MKGFNMEHDGEQNAFERESTIGLNPSPLWESDHKYKIEFVFAILPMIIQLIKSDAQNLISTYSFGRSTYMIFLKSDI